MICPHCGADNPDNSQYCSLCLGTLYQGETYENNRTGETIGVDDMIPSWEATPAPANVPQVDPMPGAEMQAPASDVYAAREYAPYQRTQSSVPKPKKKEILIFSLVFALIAVVALAGFLVLPGIIGKRTFSSSTSGLSFKYPRGWEEIQMPTDQLSQMSGIDFGQGPLQTEVILADSTDMDVSNVLAASTTKLSEVGGDWSTVKNQVETGFDQEGSTGSLEGVTFTPTRLEDVHIDGKQGIRFAYDYSVANMLFKVDGVVLLNGDTLNYIALAGLNDTDSGDTFQQIVDSVKFE